MDNTDYWKRTINRRTWIYYWLSESIDSVALLTHQLYHDLEEVRYQTLILVIEPSGNRTFSVVAVVSKDVLTKKQSQAFLESVPGNPINDNHWAKGR